MMHILAFLGVVLALGYFFPRATNVAACLITFGFIVPLFVVGMGAFGYLLTAVFTDANLSFVTCCGVFGGLAALLMVAAILS